VSDFTPYLDICSGSSIFKVRQLSAVCLVRLLSSPDSVINWLIRLCDRLEQDLPENSVHGILLQVGSESRWPDAFVKTSPIVGPNTFFVIINA
jgi:hypothetical protein